MPILVFSWPLVLVTLIFVIPIKIRILRYYWKNQSSKKITISVTKSNMLLAFIGMPLLSLTWCFLIYFPLVYILVSLDSSNFEIPEFLFIIINLVVAPGTMFLDISTEWIAILIAITLICYSYLSYRFELYYHKSTYQDQDIVIFRKGIKVANIISCLSTEIFLIILWYYNQ